MKIRVWIAFAITYFLVVFMAILVSHILNRMLQTPQMDEYITTGISILAATVGTVLAIIYSYEKRKKR